MNTKQLAKELYNKCNYVIKWESAKHLHKYWLNVAKHVQKLLIAGKIEEAERRLILTRDKHGLPQDFSRGYRQCQENFEFLAQQRIAELQKQLTEV